MKLVRILALGALISGGAGVLYYGFLWDHYYDTLPRSAQSAMGRVYTMNLRGRVVYATRRERDNLRAINWVSGILALLGLAGYILTSEDYWRKMGWHYPEKPGDPLQSGPSPPTSASERNESEQPH